MTDYKVSYPELSSAGDSFQGLHATAQDQVSALDSVQLTQADFGRVPWLQTRIFEAFQDHTAECGTALDELVAVLQQTSDGLHLCAESYEAIEAAATEAINEFFGEA
ncbi:hypothetical protein GCM10025789_16670 [Tessaracoccus lubricantis]|uniref:ESX-1 secretion-associated protein n=1 Tax=Tessaracoccus lubricantis TaxID=545543 RepID=A0ABP9FCD1_9ACTN